MNIIALLESISLDKSRIGSFSREEYTQIKKELVAQKELNPEIEDSDITQLLKALKTHPDSFLAVLNNRILFNFFARKDYARKNFSNDFASIETEKVKAFVQLFFGEELNSIFKLNLDSNKFNEISHLAQANNYFPDNLNFALRQHSLDKLDEAIEALRPPYGNLFKVLYVRDNHFFTFLSQISDWEVERKVKELFDVVMNIYKHDHNSELANKTFLAMNNYTASDEEFSKKIKKNKDIADTKFEAYLPKRRNLTWVYFVVGGFVFIRIIIFFATFNMNNDSYDDQTYDNQDYDDTEYSQEPPKIDKYYTNMKYQIDSFRTFLADYKQSEIKQFKQNVILKTGENPFETFYQNPPTADSNHYITITNKTGYDMVLLENTVLYDSIKIPQSAHFIKAGDNLEINFNSSYTETIFNMYIGKKWGTFQTNKNLFIRRQSIVEYRFSQLVPSAKEILSTDYNFINDAVITYSNGNLNVDSNGVKVNHLKQGED
jgi:hypothetical protein